MPRGGLLREDILSSRLNSKERTVAAQESEITNLKDRISEFATINEAQQNEIEKLILSHPEYDKWQEDLEKVRKEYGHLLNTMYKIRNIRVSVKIPLLEQDKDEYRTCYFPRWLATG